MFVDYALANKNINEVDINITKRKRVLRKVMLNIQKISFSNVLVFKPIFCLYTFTMLIFYVY